MSSKKGWYFAMISGTPIGTCGVCGREIHDRGERPGEFVIAEDVGYVCDACARPLISPEHRQIADALKRWFREEEVPSNDDD